VPVRRAEKLALPLADAVTVGDGDADDRRDVVTVDELRALTVAAPLCDAVRDATLHVAFADAE
jgi:hypothetical protein